MNFNLIDNIIRIFNIHIVWNNISKYLIIKNKQIIFLFQSNIKNMLLKMLIFSLTKILILLHLKIQKKYFIEKWLYFYNKYEIIF